MRRGMALAQRRARGRGAWRRARGRWAQRRERGWGCDAGGVARGRGGAGGGRRPVLGHGEEGEGVGGVNGPIIRTEVTASDGRGGGGEGGGGEEMFF